MAFVLVHLLGVVLNIGAALYHMKQLAEDPRR